LTRDHGKKEEELASRPQAPHATIAEESKKPSEVHKEMKVKRADGMEGQR